MKPIQPKVAVIQFPGTNCEYETAAALQAAGMQSEIFRWNRNASELDAFEGFVLPGGFSYQDRIRAGAVASKKKIMHAIVRAAHQGKPVMGICNGAQILVETGLIPGTVENKVQMALASNRTGSRGGYICEWIYLKAACSEKTAFNRYFKYNDIIPVPIAHAEGRFISNDPDVIKTLAGGHLVGFEYCSADGIVSESFPINPNGTIFNIAGLYNSAGNVLALMPHPERAAWMRQIPMDLHHIVSQLKKTGDQDLKQQRLHGPGMAFFLSMRDTIAERLQ